MSALPASDPWLALPLDGVRLVEASAGTGKTFTLATLVTRLVVERDLRLAQVLAVTFTEAATQELRARIRKRLELALALVDAPPANGEPPETALTRQLLDAHRARSGEAVAALRRRLRRAVDEIDLAAVFTIHGFCARVLCEHALESGQGFDPPELLANDRALRGEVAADLWRALAVEADTADDLLALWSEGPDALAADLPALLREPVLLPPAGPLPPDPAPALQAAGHALAAGFRAHGDEFLAALLGAVEAKVLNGNSYRADWIGALWVALGEWCGAGVPEAPLDPRIARLTAQALQGKTNKGKEALTPQSPLCALIPPYLDALEARRRHVALRRANLLHRLRGEARARLAALKRRYRVQTYDDLIDGVADALDGPRGDALARRLRAQYRIALVDEFQDTDARQWRIFDRVFGSGSAGSGQAPALFLIGDPKQAIYGFRGGDVHTYLDAARVAVHAPPLAHNFRSRPSLLAAIGALYANAQRAFADGKADTPPFVDPRIDFRPVQPGDTRADADYRRDGAPAPALTVWCVADPPTDAAGRRKPWDATTSRDQATAACVTEIHRVLQAGRDGTATLRDGEAWRPVRAGDIAVLVRSHAEATRIQRALADAGIPAVAAGRQSLYATAEARELHTLLLALLHGADDGRLRAALATVLVGLDAAGIEALESDADAHLRWQHRALAWRERLLRGGPLALVGDLCAEHAGRLLGLVDGERRVSNYLQLAEALQEAQVRALGLQGLVDGLGRRIAGADPNDDTQLLRLESDARRVQIVTLHKSKGLEYPLVFLPFAGIGAREPSSKPGKRVITHSGQERLLHWPLDAESDEWNEAKQEWLREQRAEDARLLYVGLTRAEHALWLAGGPLYRHAASPLQPMLGDLDALGAGAGARIDRAAPPPHLPRLPPESDAAVPPARQARRALSHDWWVYSFTQLANAEAGDGGEAAHDTSVAATLPATGGRDEPATPDPAAPDDANSDPAFDPRFAGNRFGVALHAALEHADFAAWRDWQPGRDAPPGQARVIAEALREGGYATGELDDGLALATALIGHTLTVALPEGARLCALPAGERRAEIEFQFALQPTRVDALLRLLHAHGVVRERHGFGQRQRLEGLMTGLIDLTYRHAGRWYVLDYKSNRLPRYDAAALDAAMAHSEYDLQALIYTLALHRWLRFRLGAAYDYARDFGGVRYLFCRGLDAARADSPGIHAARYAPELVNALDALFGHDVAGAAA